MHAPVQGVENSLGALGAGDRVGGWEALLPAPTQGERNVRARRELAPAWLRGLGAPGHLGQAWATRARHPGPLCGPGRLPVGLGATRTPLGRTGRPYGLPWAQQKARHPVRGTGPSGRAGCYLAACCPPWAAWAVAALASAASVAGLALCRAWVKASAVRARRTVGTLVPCCLAMAATGCPLPPA